MGFKGSVESFSLADVFQNLAMNQQTGTLRVVAGAGEEKHIYFQAGQVKYLSRGANHILLPGEVFAARGLVNKANLEAALERQSQSHHSVGRVLVEMGVLNEQQNDDVFRHQVEEEIYDLFGWEKAQFEFNEGPPPADVFNEQTDTEGASLPISHLIMEAARRVDEWERLRRSVPSFKEIYVIDLPIRKAIEKGELELEAIERRVVSLVDGTRDVEDVVADSWLFRFEVLGAMAGLIQSSVLRTASIPELNFAEQECVRQNLPKRRIKVLERILAMGGENQRLRRELAETLAKDGQTDKACIHLNVLADAAVKNSKDDDAIELYRRVLAISPKHAKSSEALASLLYKRNSKREAYLLYRDLYEVYRDQNQMREARIAATLAVECDPNQSDLRSHLIDMLLAEGQREPAGQHLELLGDAAVRAGNVKLAADSYRRSMQHRPASKQVKKKLQEVLLTKEDRLARKRRVQVILGIVAFIIIVAGSLAALEYSNHKRLNLALEAAQDNRDKAEKILIGPRGEHAPHKYQEAGALYDDAISALTRARGMFSPIMQYDRRVNAEIEDLEAKVSEFSKLSVQSKSTAEKSGRVDFEEGVKLRDSGDPYGAVAALKKVDQNPYTPDDVRAAAKKILGGLNVMISKFEAGKARIERPPETEFRDSQGRYSVRDEYVFKKGFIQDFRPLLKTIPTIRLPLLVKPNTDGVKVFVDGRQTWVVSASAGAERNTIRYNSGETVTFEFRKEGHGTVRTSTTNLEGYEFVANLDREPSLSIFLPNHSFSGQAVLVGESIFAGTIDGGIVQINEGQPEKPAREFKLKGSGLGKEVFGDIHVETNGNKVETIIFCTKDGDCIALMPTPNSDTFDEKWSVKPGTSPLSARPTVLRLPSLNRTVVALPAGKSLFLVETSGGTLISGKAIAEFPANISASATLFPGKESAIVGCQNGRLYSVNLLDPSEKTREWTTKQDASFIHGRPIFTNDDRMVAVTNDGRLFFFDMAENSSFPDGNPLKVQGEIYAPPLVLRDRMYVGTRLTEGLWCILSGSRDLKWARGAPENVTNWGALSYPVVSMPAFQDRWIYFNTDNGRLYSLDADKGNTRWMYQVKGGGRFVGSPIIKGKRVYGVTSNGRIVRFDEFEEE